MDKLTRFKSQTMVDAISIGCFDYFDKIKYDKSKKKYAYSSPDFDETIYLSSQELANHFDELVSEKASFLFDFFEIVEQQDCFVVDNKYEIVKADGTVYYSNNYVGRKKDFPLYVFYLRDILLNIPKQSH